jgi:hypothetical protein
MNKEVPMASFASPFPHTDFKAVSRLDPDDHGRKCRVLHLTDGQHRLQIKSKAGFINAKQAPFPTADAAMSWAISRYTIDGDLEH